MIAIAVVVASILRGDALRQVNWLWVAGWVILASLAQGFAFLAIDLGSRKAIWAEIATLACFAGLICAARRLRWWLLLFVPAAWVVVNTVLGLQVETGLIGAT
jgi:hypothetical protein